MNNTNMNNTNRKLCPQQDAVSRGSKICLCLRNDLHTLFKVLFLFLLWSLWLVTVWDCTPIYGPKKWCGG